MAQEPGAEGARMVLEWVSCPNCSTTFRIAAPTQYRNMEIEWDEGEIKGHYQKVTCVDDECSAEFYLAYSSTR